MVERHTGHRHAARRSLESALATCCCDTGANGSLDGTGRNDGGKSCLASARGSSSDIAVATVCAHYVLGLLYCEEGRYRQALHRFNDALFYSPSEHKQQLLLHSAWCTWKLGGYLEAQALYAAILDADPFSWAALLDRATMAMDHRQWAAALVDLDLVLAMRPPPLASSARATLSPSVPIAQSVSSVLVASDRKFELGSSSELFSAAPHAVIAAAIDDPATDMEAASVGLPERMSAPCLEAMGRESEGATVLLEPGSSPPKTTRSASAPLLLGGADAGELTQATVRKESSDADERRSASEMAVDDDEGNAGPLAQGNITFSSPSSSVSPLTRAATTRSAARTTSAECSDLEPSAMASVQSTLPAIVMTQSQHGASHSRIGGISNSATSARQIREWAAKVLSDRAACRMEFDKGPSVAAASDLDMAITLAPGYAQAFINRGNCRRMQGMLTEARSDFSHAIELDGNNAKAYSNRGALLLLEARYKDALADFEQAIRFDPHCEIALRNHELAMQHIKERQRCAARSKPTAAVVEGPQPTTSTIEIRHPYEVA